MMKFKFNVNLTDEDYLNYNIFWTIRSPYGKKQLMQLRIAITAVICIVAFLSLCGGGFSGKAFIGIIPYMIALGVFHALCDCFFVSVLKRQIKTMKKTGKMGYSPVSEMEFYENEFVEITPVNKTEQKYSSIERISIVGKKTLYIHINNVASHILPISCFESNEQYEDFLSFMKTKCANIDTYR